MGAGTGDRRAQFGCRARGRVRAHAEAWSGADDVENAGERALFAGGQQAVHAGALPFGDRGGGLQGGGGAAGEKGEQQGQPGQEQGMACRQRSGRFGAELDLGAQLGDEAEERRSRGGGAG
jgi:hypothetical protein